MHLLPPSFVGRASRALNPRHEQWSAAKKEKLLPLQMIGVTFHWQKQKKTYIDRFGPLIYVDFYWLKLNWIRNQIEHYNMDVQKG